MDAASLINNQHDFYLNKLVCETTEKKFSQQIFNCAMILPVLESGQAPAA